MASVVIGGSLYQSALSLNVHLQLLHFVYFRLALQHYISNSYFLCIFSNFKDKKVKPDVQIGRHLYTVMTTLTPHVDAQAFEEMFKSSVDEMELCMRIAQLTRAQLSVAEMLQKTAVIETPVTTAQ